MISILLSGSSVFISQIIVYGASSNETDLPHRPYTLRVIFEADTPSPSPAEMDDIIQLMRRRLDAIGIIEANLRTHTNRIIFEVDYRIIDDPEQLIAEISSKGLVTFTDENGNVLLTGEHIARAIATTENMLNIVRLDFTEEGAELFAEATRINIGRPIMVLMDDELISAPIVHSVIYDGTANISGDFSLDSAEHFASTIRMGALPFGLSVVSVDVLEVVIASEVGDVDSSYVLTPSSADNAAPDEGQSYLWVLIAIGVVLLFALLLVVIVASKKKASSRKHN